MIIPTHLLCQLWTNPPEVEFQETISKFRKRNNISSLLVCVLHKTRMQLRRSSAKTAEKCTKKCDARAKLLFWLLRRHPLGHSVILIFSGQKSCTTIIWSILHSFLHFSRAKDVINHPEHQKNFSWEPEKMNVKFYKITSYTWNF